MSLDENVVFGEIESTPEAVPLPTGPALLTVAEVSTMLRVSKMTIYRMVHSGELSHVRVGRSFRIPINAVHEILGNRAPGDQFHV
jgi:excisionase family DNA binding protein